MSPCHPFRPVPGQCGPNRRGPLPAPPFDPRDYWATKKFVSSLFESIETKIDKFDVVDPSAEAEAGKAADAKGTYEGLNRVLGVASDARVLAESKADKAALDTHVASTSNPHAVTAEQINAYTKDDVETKLAKKADRATTLAGYGITDAATKAELAAKADLVDGKVPAAQLPSYVDDVLEYDTMSAFPATGEDSKIYVAKDTNLVYRWSGTQYVEISPSPAFDNTVTETSQNGVKSSGIWSWVKSLLPHWLTSDYAEPATVASVADKRDKADRAVYSVTQTENTDWTWTSENKDLEAALNEKRIKILYDNDTIMWSVNEDPSPHWSYTPSQGNEDDLSVVMYFAHDNDFSNLIPATATRPRYMDETLGPAKQDQKIAAVATEDAARPADGSLMKYDAANDRFVKAVEGVDYLKTHQDISGKRDNGDLAVYSGTRTENTDWTWESENKELEAALNDATAKPTYDSENHFWVITGTTHWGEFYYNSPGVYDADALSVRLAFITIPGYVDYYATATRPRYMDEALGPAKPNQQLAAVATDDAAKPADGSLMKYDAANDRFVKATAGTDYADEAKGTNRQVVRGSVFDETKWNISVASSEYAREADHAREAGFVMWSYVEAKPTTLSGYGITDAAPLSMISATDTTFASAVRAVPTTDMPEGMPTDWGTYGTVGAALAALAAGLKWIKNILGSVASGYSTFAEWIASKYTKPSGGIPASDLALTVQSSLDAADAAAPQATTYTKDETDAAIRAGASKGQMTNLGNGRYEYTGALADASTQTYPREVA